MTPLTFPPDPARLRQVRQGARERAAALGADAAACDAVSLVVDELVNNAIEHGASYRNRGADLSVSVGRVSGRVTVDFVDPEMPENLVRELAAMMQEAADGAPPLDNERGRGLFLISIYMEELRVDLAPGGGLLVHGRLATPD